MKAFDSAYLRLTGWYVLIIMVISLLFSFWVYNQARDELRSGLGKAVPFSDSFLQPSGTVDKFGPENYTIFLEKQLTDSRNRLIMRLTFLNSLVLVAGAGASYWLARRTLAPVRNAVEAQERFTADASHELRTPLAAMKTEIEVGLRAKNLSGEDAVALLKSNLEEIDRMSALADGLLALTQTDTVPAMAVIDLEKVVEKSVKRLRPLAEVKSIALHTELQPIMAHSDAGTIEKILGILLDNAIKYSPKRATVTVRIYATNNHAVLEVADTGIGIKAGELPHIFERFYRADSSRSQLHVSGHGLGLSIAKKLAESINATITARSVPGEGSVFQIRLPLEVVV